MIVKTISTGKTIITSCATKRNTHGTLTFEFEEKSMETEIAI